jgi:chloride channel, nucleotide-sensitive, 1A
MALAVITSVPHHVSEEQHRELVSSTPSSFSEIPPTLCHREENISVVLDPPLQGFSEEDGATGTLYLLSS